MLTQEDIQQIVAALVPVIQEAVAQEVTAATAEPDLDDMGEAGGEVEGLDTRPDIEGEGMDDDAKMYQNDDNEAGDMEGDQPSDDEPVAMKYQRERDSIRIKYQKEKQAREAAETKLKNVTEELEVVRSLERHSNRYQKLDSLSQDYVLEVDDELEFTKTFSDEQFDAYVERIPARYQRVMRSFLPIPKGKIDKPTEEEERRKVVSERAMAIANRYQKQGKHMSYDACLKQAESELTTATA